MRLHEIDAHVPGLEEVLQSVYDLAIFEHHQRPFYRSLDEPAATRPTSDWALDMRVPLCRPSLLRPVATEMTAYLAQVGITQVAGYGYGSFALVGAVVAHAGTISGGFVREERKRYGFGEVVEGDLDPSVPVVVLDDLLGAGRSALRAAASLRSEGFQVQGVYTVFRFGWRSGRRALRERGLAHRCLGTLHQVPALASPEERRLAGEQL